MPSPVQSPLVKNVYWTLPVGGVPLIRSPSVAVSKTLEPKGMDEPLAIVALPAAFFSVVVAVGCTQLETSSGAGPTKSFN